VDVVVVPATTALYRVAPPSFLAGYTFHFAVKQKLQEARLRAQLTREGKLSNEQFGEIDKRAKEEALASVRFAEKSAQPPLEDLYKYTYLNGVEVNVSARKSSSSAGTAGKQERAADTAAP